jgi:tetratricopeptide (TPR) repeat protein
MIALFSYRAYRPYFHLRVSLLLLTAMMLSVFAVRAQTSEPQIASSPARIARDIEWIRIAEQDHRPDAERGALWTQLALEYQYAADFAKAEDAYNKSLHLLKTAPSARAEYATALECLASLYLIYGHTDEAERARKQAFAVREKLGNLSDIGLSRIHLANVAIERSQFKKAERTALQGIKEMESAPNPPRVGMLTGLITLTYAQCRRGHSSEGLMSAQQALAFANEHFEPESAAVGFALGALGLAEWKSGAVQDGEKDMLHGIQILRTKLAPTDPRLAGALLEYHDYLVATSRRVEAQVVHDEVDRISSQSGTFCPGCTVSVNSLSNSLR